MKLLQACANSQNLLDRVLSTIQHVIVVTDFEGQILFANPAVKQALGYTPEELEGKKLAIIFPSEDLSYLYPNLLSLARKNEPYEEELMLIRKNETRFFASMVFRPYFDPEQGRSLIVISIQDIDKQKQLEKVLRQNHYEDLIKVANGIAHEIRNPLVGIGGFVKRLYKSCREVYDNDRYYECIINNLKKIENLVKKVEFFAQTPKPFLKEVSLTDVVESALQPYMEEMEKRKIDSDIGVGDVILFIDSDLVSRVFSILIENALDVLSDGGSIRIYSKREDNQCSVYVTDSGSGIPKEDLPYIFNPFFSTKATGAGIDLAVAKRIMESHRGSIDVRSKEGEGATFILTFPLERRRSIRIARLED